MAAKGFRLRPLLPGVAGGFLAGGRPGPAFPGPVAIIRASQVVEKPAQAGAAIRVGDRRLIPAVAGGENHIGDRLPAVLGSANAFGHGSRPLLPGIPSGGFRLHSALPSKIDYTAAIIPRLGIPLGPANATTAMNAAVVARSPIRANQGARVGDIRASIGSRRAAADVPPLDPLSPPPFLSRELKDAVNADPGNAGFPVGQITLLGGDKAAELAALPEIDGVIPLVAVFAGFPGFSFGKGVGLVNAAVKGLAPVLGQGFQDGRSPVGMGKGLPVGAVPGDGAGLSILIPPPQKRLAKGLRKAGQAKA